jgi:hypothetical protein
MKDLAKLVNEHLTSRHKIRCFLDTNFNGISGMTSWNDLPNLVACSSSIVVFLSENFVESPWCVLELLSAILYERPIIFLKISMSFKFASLRKQLVTIGFPFVDDLDQYSVEIDYSEIYFGAAMAKVVERMQANAVTHPLLLPGDSGSVGTAADDTRREEVSKRYEILRAARDQHFPEKRSWPSWGGVVVDVSRAVAPSLSPPPPPPPQIEAADSSGERNLVSKTTPNGTSSLSCPPGAVSVQPGTNSIVNGMKRAKEKGTCELYLEEGIHIVTDYYVVLTKEWKIIGAGQNKTIVQGGGFRIEGKKLAKKYVELNDMTISGAKVCGLIGKDSLSFLCKDMTFTQCGTHGISAVNTKGRLINCAITQCGDSGVWCGENALIELEGSQTKIHGNVTDRNSGDYGLNTYVTNHARIHLLFPLTKESVSTNNYDDQNYSPYGGEIETVKTFANEETDSTTIFSNNNVRISHYRTQTNLSVNVYTNFYSNNIFV